MNNADVKALTGQITRGGIGLRETLSMRKNEINAAIEDDSVNTEDLEKAISEANLTDVISDGTAKRRTSRRKQALEPAE